MKKTVLILGNAPAKSFLKFFFVLGSICLFGITVKSQILWTAPAGQAWLLNTNWASSTVPSTTEIAQFGADPTSGATGVGINMNGTTNNGANNQAVGAIEITNARTANLLVGNSSTSTSGILTLNGATVNTISNVVIRNNSIGVLNIDNTQALGTQTMTLSLGSPIDNKVYIDNTGDIIINTAITGSSRTLSLYGTGTGVLQLNAANTYDGMTTVSATTLQLNNPSGGTLPSTNDVTINGTGTLRISSNQTLSHLYLETGGTLIIDNGVTLTINATLNHNGGNIILNGTGKIQYQPIVGGQLSYGAGFAQTTTSKEFPATGGPNALIIQNPNGVTLHASRTISSTLSFVSGNFILGNNNFTTGSNISGGSPTSYVVTNGSGKLTCQNVSTQVLFPIGTATTFNPLNIGNGTNTGSLDYTVSVGTGFSSPIIDPTLAINRTWHVTTSATPVGSVLIDFYYTGSPATDAGSAFLTSAPANLGLYLTSPFYNWWGWMINNMPTVNLTQNAAPWAGMYVVNTSVVSFLGNIDLPMVIGNGGAVLSISRSIDLTVQKQSSKAILNWTYNNVTGIKEVAVERSINGRSFDKLATAASLITTYTDDNLLAGTNYYRIKITDINGKITYSAIAAIINATDGFDLIALLPNIVHTDMQVSIAAAQKTKLDMAITDVMGRPVSKLQFTAIAGSNMFDVNVSKLSAGIYYLTAISAEGNVKTLRFVKF